MSERVDYPPRAREAINELMCKKDATDNRMREYIEYITRYERGEDGTLIQRIGYGYEPIAERIVRCRDCRVMRVKYGNTGIECWMNGEPFTVEPDGFCKWGEPK